MYTEYYTELFTVKCSSPEGLDLASRVVEKRVSGRDSKKKVNCSKIPFSHRNSKLSRKIKKFVKSFSLEYEISFNLIPRRARYDKGSPSSKMQHRRLKSKINFLN